MKNFNDEKPKDNRIVPIQSLQPWGKTVTLFAREELEGVMAWLEMVPVKKASVGGNTHIPNWCGTQRATCTTMKLLLVHQNFPGQFRDLGPALCDRGHELKAIGSSQRTTDPRIEVLRYSTILGERSGMHPHSLEVDEWIHRSEKVANLAMGLKQRGWAPDVMLAHPGWGEALLLRQVFPSTPLVIWPELWLRPEHMGIDPAEY